MLKNRKFLLAIRLILGAVFIASSIGKLQQPHDFALYVVACNLLPYSISLAIGYCLPWLELIIGVVLVTGFFTRHAAMVSMLLIASFTITNSCELIADPQGVCGCFGISLVVVTYAVSLVIDFVMMFMAVCLFLYGARIFKFV